MDVVWLILDSLSASETPFVPDGRETMPRLSDILKGRAKIFTRAYVPGPASPSSHGSLFTGRLPSETGMSEASPYFHNPDMETIAGAVRQTHRSLLISSNPFVFNGLQRDFDDADDLRSQQYLLFEGGSDPGRTGRKTLESSRLRRYLSFVVADGAPLRSILNGIAYKVWLHRQGAGIPKDVSQDETNYQYANTMNERIRRYLADHGDAFVVANYMDVHPPFDVSDEAIAAVDSPYPRAELPIGVRGNEVYDEIQSGNMDIGGQMRTLYRAATWDLDRKLAPLIESLLDSDVHFVVTADHGTWFDRTRELDEERIHVPLLLAGPSVEPGTISKTVNLRSLPRSTMAALGREYGDFPGPALQNVTDDQLSVTEYIHNAESDAGPVVPEGGEGQTRLDIAAIEGDTRVDMVDEALEVVRSGGRPERVERLQDFIESHNTGGHALSA